MRYVVVSLRALLVFTLLTGIAYPLAVTVLAKAIYPHQAGGSLVKAADGKLVGSSLIAQGFKNERYFWPRPSAVDYNPLPSGGSNLGPTSKALQEKWAERSKLGLTGEMLATSASGLDPEITPSAALAQLTRVARARGRAPALLESLIFEITKTPQLGFLGESRVNILRLNLLLDERFP